MQRAGATQDRVEFRPLGELELLDDLAGEVAGRDELTRLVTASWSTVELRSSDFSASGRRKMFSRVLDQDPRFRLVSGSDEADCAEGKRRGEQRQPDDQEFLAPERAAESPEIDLGGGLPYARPAVRLYARLHDHLTPTRTTRDLTQVQTIMVDAALSIFAPLPQ